jgi:thiol:disulfide interchange protein DsbD
VTNPAPGAGRLARRIGVVLLLAAGVALAELPSPAAGPPLAWRTDLDASLEAARAERRPVLVSFHADWCSICARLDRRTLRHPEVAAELDRFVRVRVDVSERGPGTDALMGRFGVVALPTLVLVDSQGVARPEQSPVGFVNPDELLSDLRRVR